MTVAARKIDWKTWSQSRFLAWAETQPEFCRYEFDGFQPVAMAPATVGHDRIGRNIREAIRAMLPAGGPCDTYGPLDTIETVGGASVPDTYAALNRIIKDWTPCAFRLRFQALRFLIPIRGCGSTAKERK